MSRRPASALTFRAAPLRREAVTLAGQIRRIDGGASPRQLANGQGAIRRRDRRKRPTVGRAASQPEQAEQPGLAFARQIGARSLADLRAMSPQQLSPQGAAPLRFFPMVDRFKPLYPANTDAERSAQSKRILLDCGLGSIWSWAEARERRPGARLRLSLHLSRAGAAICTLWCVPFLGDPLRAGHAGYRARAEFLRRRSPAVAHDVELLAQFRQHGQPERRLPSGVASLPRGAAEYPAHWGYRQGGALLPPAKLDAIKAFVAAGGSLSPF